MAQVHTERHPSREDTFTSTVGGAAGFQSDNWDRWDGYDPRDDFPDPDEYRDL